MQFEARITPDGAFIPALITCNEFSLFRHIYFLIDTGSAISALSSKDLGGDIDYSSFDKKSEAAIGIGGSLECYLIHEVKLFLFTAEENWIELTRFDSMCLLPPSIDLLTKTRIYLPSIIGRDILGTILDLYYLKDKIYLEI
ncbi:MAG: hypothetical protein EU529_05170 [Promethearchaeota archaeon]|nr:MAG: hypothetical protein EU529_05170 [Candidatus Lokiarchaeota archaeon]